MSFSRVLTNDPSATRLISLTKLSMAAEVHPRDPHGPYVILQTGYVPGDLTMKAADHLLGRSGAWLAFHWFIRMPVTERRAEFVFGMVAEVMALMENLAGEVRVISSPDGIGDDAPADAEWHGVIAGG